MTQEQQPERKEEWQRIAQLLKEALSRIEKPSPNGNGGTMQVGGIYWRLMNALKLADSELEMQEGDEHAAYIRNSHGIPAAVKP